MDNTKELKKLIKQLIKFAYKCCPSNFANELFALENKAKNLGVFDDN